jgi:iron complex outermembrane receptor protein
MTKGNLLRKTRPTPFTATLLAIVASLTLPIATPAQDTNGPTKLKPTVVTGSFIPTADTVGASPVDTVSSADIERVGTQDILTTLKTFSAAFSGNGNIGQGLNNGGFGEAYIAIRNLPTLVLIDGKRLGISPFSTFVQTFAPDVNMIPVGMIDHIEVLKDGASTIYGSDAIGGVVNIITKKRADVDHKFFSPWWGDVDAHYGIGLDKGSYTEQRYSGNIGFDNGPTRLVAGGQYYLADPIFTKDRDIGSLNAQQLAAAGLNAPSYFSPSYPGRVGSFILAGSPLAAGAPGFIAGLNAPPVVSGGPFSTVQAYNAAAQSQLGFTPYIPITSTPASQALGGTTASILNTTLLGPISLQQQDRKSAFANLEQDIFGTHLTAYGQLIYSESQSKGQLAPAPIPALTLYNLTIPSNNPANIFGTTIGSGQSTNDPTIPVRSRLIETGPRTFETTSSLWHFLAGGRGDLLDNRLHYDINAAYSQTTSKQLQNSASSVLLNEAMTPDGTGLSQLAGPGGAHVPIYNLLALPGVNDPATISAISAKDGQDGFSDLLELQGVFSIDVFQLPAGYFQLAPGAQFVHEKLVTTAGDLLSSGNLIGLNALPPFPGGIREREAGFIEAKIPVTSPDLHVPGFYSFEIGASGRYETIDSHTTAGGGINSHNTLVPKVTARWQPIDDQLTIRGTYSQGFVVPQLTQLFGPPLNSFPYVVTPTDTNDLTSIAAQENVNYIANPDLPPVTAETMTAGVVFSPKCLKGLTVSLDFYHIESGYNFIASGSRMVADLNANGVNSTFANNPALHGIPVYQDLNGNAVFPTPGDPTTYITAANFGTLNIPTLPGGTIRTEGIDLGLSYRYDTKNWGIIDLFGNANILLDYQIRLGDGTPWLDYKGQYTDSQAVAAPQGMIPDYNLTVGFTYSLFNFDYTVIAHYLPSVADLGDLHGSVGAPANDFTVSGRPWKVNDYYRVDMQLAYNIKSKGGNKWYDNTRLAVGVNNITDQKPNLIASSSEDNTDKGSYDILGRLLYFEISKKF